MLDRFVPEIGLDRPGIDALIGQLKTAAVPQHVRVKLHIEASGLTGPLDQRLKAALRKNGAPRSLMKTNGDLGCSRCNRRRLVILARSAGATPDYHS
jgi:hypothetical protein